MGRRLRLGQKASAEHTNGLNGFLSVRELDDGWDAAWRRNQKGHKSEQSRRRKVISLIDALMKNRHWTEEQTLTFIRDRSRFPLEAGGGRRWREFGGGGVGVLRRMWFAQRTAGVWQACGTHPISRAQTRCRGRGRESYVLWHWHAAASGGGTQTAGARQMSNGLSVLAGGVCGGWRATDDGQRAVGDGSSALRVQAARRRWQDLPDACAGRACRERVLQAACGRAIGLALAAGRVRGVRVQRVVREASAFCKQAGCGHQMDISMLTTLLSRGIKCFLQLKWKNKAQIGDIVAKIRWLDMEFIGHVCNVQCNESAEPGVGGRISTATYSDRSFARCEVTPQLVKDLRVDISFSKPPAGSV
ncbi:hypothetical protein GGX14DRAFT_406041 [Mycena pura]|uniref:Transcription activator GCR1-like domain-containing protein n=1 Tax=Mycena pura TaxID=153505 RepID=A0AAD6XZZ6_9AGAR|nr:hypothetical protein GGX14DRAFT_406041 [Mycena pura]